jgi:tetratricopeptide (TPR) repeat protein
LTTSVDGTGGSGGPLPGGEAPGRRPRRGPDPDRLAELEEERRFLLASLRDLEREHDAGDLDDTDYQSLKDGYTARAAAVLRELEDGRRALPPKRPVRWGRRLAWVGAVVALAVISGLLVARFSGQRLPNDTLTGDISESLNTLLAEARQLQAADPQGAIDAYQRVLEQDPDNTEALTYRGWLLIRVGADAVARGLAEGNELVARGMEGLDRAIELRPSYADPHCFRGITLFRFYADAQAAKPSVDTCVASNPPAVVRDLVANLQGEVDAALSGTDPTTPSTSAGTSPAP